ncbi:pentapeptide repeat-containing protein [Nonomuraea sp. M3C6]|uniref:Pentapeptide repeat-containing protein n=1 Tax=Nonomuraea marmarensis TaxID=3351344 RepID=A0ABW7AUP5_9ACTN
MTDKRRRLPSQGTILLVAAVLLLAGLVWVLGPGARWVVDLDVDVTKLAEKDLATAADAVRGRALAIATGVVALAAVYYTARNAETARRTVELTQQTSTRTLELTEQGQVTDRYTKAIQQLSDVDNLHIRIGGIYALEHIARDSERDHRTVQEVLTAFVRGYVRDPEPPPPQVEEDGKSQDLRGTRFPEVRADVQAALTVIGRADMPDADLRRADLAGADLTGAILTGAKLGSADLGDSLLGGADLSNAFLGNAVLSSAYLVQANLASTILIAAELPRAHLVKANLTGTDLTGANLTSAELTSADLTEATLDQADLTGAKLEEADLSDAILTHAKLSRAELVDARLTRAKLTGADLTGADLFGADLAGADLFGADLTGANLSAANLTGVDLKYTKLERQEYESAASTEGAIPPARFVDDPPEEQAKSS